MDEREEERERGREGREEARAFRDKGRQETNHIHHLTFDTFRLTSRLLALIQLFTTAEHPLVLFVDDLQWADAMSLNLIQLLFEQPSAHLLIIGCVAPPPLCSSPAPSALPLLSSILTANCLYLVHTETMRSTKSTL